MMQLGGMFISNCNNALRVSDAFCVHPQEHLRTVVTASGVWQFLSAAEDEDKKRPKHVEYYCSY